MTVDITSALFQLPEVITDTLYKTVVPNQITDLTTGDPSGTGAFDLLMASAKAQLSTEYESGRITGSEYTKAYIETTQAALQAALQFVMGNSQSYWQAQNAQIAAITGLIQLETARYNYSNILPAELAMHQSQKTGQDTANSIAAYNLSSMLPEQLALLTSQKTSQDTQNAIASYNLNYIIPAQYYVSQMAGQTANYQLSTMLPAQYALLQAQRDVQLAQVSDTISSGATVAGVLGKQKGLYAQQITSYQRDAECKAAKIFTDSWITQKTIDSGLTAPTAFTNNSVNEVLTVIMANNSFGAPVP